MPTCKELFRSASAEQCARALWCVWHFGVAAFILYSASGGSLAHTALSHLVVFDALGAALCAAVDVLSNFDVWRRSSIRHPFGLERVEVLAGFAISVLLLFMGFDIVSHCSEHLLEGLWADAGSGTGGSAGADGGDGAGASSGGIGREPAAAHAHLHPAWVAAGCIDIAALTALLTTLASATFLRNHARIGQG